MPWNHRNKYRAKRVEIDGISFDSQKEAKRYQELKLLEKAKQIQDLKVHPKFEIQLNGLQICTYTADFDYIDPRTKRLVVEDVKGYKKGAAYYVFKLKKTLMKALYGIEVVEI